MTTLSLVQLLTMCWFGGFVTGLLLRVILRSYVEWFT